MDLALSVCLYECLVKGWWIFWLSVDVGMKVSNVFSMCHQCMFNACLLLVSNLPSVWALGEERDSCPAQPHWWAEWRLHVFLYESEVQAFRSYVEAHTFRSYVEAHKHMAKSGGRYVTGSEVSHGRCDTSFRMLDVGQRPPPWQTLFSSFQTIASSVLESQTRYQGPDLGLGWCWSCLWLFLVDSWSSECINYHRRWFSGK